MIFISGVMKLLPPDMKSRNNFMTGECEFHDAETVDFSDASLPVWREEKPLGMIAHRLRHFYVRETHPQSRPSRRHEIRTLPS